MKGMTKKGTKHVFTPLGKTNSMCPCGNKAYVRYTGLPACPRCIAIETRMLNDRAVVGSKSRLGAGLDAYIIPKHYAKKGVERYD